MGPRDTCSKSATSSMSRFWPADKTNLLVLVYDNIRQLFSSSTSHSSFRVCALPAANATKWVFGITDHNVTMNEELQYNKLLLKLAMLLGINPVVLWLPGQPSHLSHQQRQTSAPRSAWSEGDSEPFHQPRLGGRWPGKGLLGLDSLEEKSS